MNRQGKSLDIIDRINNIGLMIAPEDLAQAMLERVRGIDQAIAGVLLMIVEFDDPEAPVHDTGVSVEQTLNLYEDRRNRLLDYIRNDLGFNSDAPAVPSEAETQSIPPIADDQATKLMSTYGEEQGGFGN